MGGERVQVVVSAVSEASSGRDHSAPPSQQSQVGRQSAALRPVLSLGSPKSGAGGCVGRQALSEARRRKARRRTDKRVRGGISGCLAADRVSQIRPAGLKLLEADQDT
jgi:hypothetical protein